MYNIKILPYLFGGKKRYILFVILRLILNSLLNTENVSTLKYLDKSFCENT